MVEVALPIGTKRIGPRSTCCVRGGCIPWVHTWMHTHARLLQRLSPVHVCGCPDIVQLVCFTCYSRFLQTSEPTILLVEVAERCYAVKFVYVPEDDAATPPLRMEALALGVWGSARQECTRKARFVTCTIARVAT